MLQGRRVFRKTGIGTCWPSQENKNIRAGSRAVSAKGRHSINPLEQVLCSWHKEMSTLFISVFLSCESEITLGDRSWTTEEPHQPKDCHVPVEPRDLPGKSGVQAPCDERD